MAGHGRGRRGRGGHAEHENDERWLLTYSDMITLLMALFMVLFSISSVNISKFKTLQESLKAAFSGSILPGGKSIIQSGSESTASHTPATSEIPSIVPLTPNIPSPAAQTSIHEQPGSAPPPAGQTAAGSSSSTQASPAQISQEQAIAAAAAQEQHDFQKLQARLTHYIKAHGLQNQVQTVISRRGLVVRVLTDKILFDSGQADLKPGAAPLLGEVAKLLNVDQ